MCVQGLLCLVVPKLQLAHLVTVFLTGLEPPWLVTVFLTGLTGQKYTED